MYLTFRTLSSSIEPILSASLVNDGRDRGLSFQQSNIMLCLEINTKNHYTINYTNHLLNNTPNTFPDKTSYAP